MRTLTVVVLVYWAMFSDGTPALSREPSTASNLMGINFSDLFRWKPNWMIFPDSPPTPSTTHAAHITTRAADQPLVIGRRPNEDMRRQNEERRRLEEKRRRAGETGREAKPQNERVAILFNGPTTASPTPTTNVTTSSFPVTDYDGLVIYPEHRASAAPITNSCTINQTSSTVDVHANLIDCKLEDGVMMINGSCQRLLAKENCAEGEWLVMLGDGAQCVLRPCPFGQLEYRGACINSSDQEVCRRGQMLFVDMDGETYCDCEPNFVYDPISGNCYSEFEQGPCDVGNFLNITETCTVECVPNLCMLDGFVWDSVSNDCHKKMYFGFCAKTMLSFRSDQGINTLECEEMINLRNIFDVATLRSCAAGSRRDFVGKCRETFRIPTFTSTPTFNNGCPSGFRKDPRGTCRRTHNLFG